MNAIIDSFFLLEPKDRFTSIGIVLTATISCATLLFSILNNQRNLYANTILKERLDSLKNLKEKSADFISLISSCGKDEIELKTNYKELVFLSTLLEYQFNKSNYKEAKDLKKINYLMCLIRMKIETKSIEESKDFIKKENLDFFILLDLEHYNEVSLKRLVTEKIYENIQVVDEVLKKHIKLEWEKIKKTQRNFR